MQNLINKSVTVIPLNDLNAHESVHGILRGIRELKDPIRAVAELDYPISYNSEKNPLLNPHPAQIVLGGYGATGLPSLTHQPMIRALRQAVYSRIAPQLATIHPNRRLELLFDRFSIRRMGTSVSEESWHRDIGPKSKGDIIYGGWMNLDPPGSHSQYFSCVPGNILPADIELKMSLNELEKLIDKEGFAKFKKGDFPALNDAFVASGGPIEVPPGSIILFDQTIAHKITGGTPLKKNSFRLYFGWRITDDILPLYNKDSIISEQLMPPLPSGQPAPMYAKLHWVNWRHRLLEFSATINDAFLEKTDKQRVGYVAKVMPGLVESGFAFDPYTEEESAIFYPQPLESGEPKFKRQKL